MELRSTKLAFPPSPPHSLTIVPPQIPYNCRELRGGRWRGEETKREGSACRGVESWVACASMLGEVLEGKKKKEDRVL